MPDANNLLLFMIITITMQRRDRIWFTLLRGVSGRGRTVGLASVLGIAAGCFVHVFAVTFGLTRLLITVPTAYEIIRDASAAYLIYLGIRTLVSRTSKDSETPHRLLKGLLRVMAPFTNNLNFRQSLLFVKDFLSILYHNSQLYS